MESSLKDIEAVLEKRASMINNRLSVLAYVIEPASLSEVVRYSLSQKGKRIRSTVLTLCCEAVGGELERAMAPAMAVELLHNTSLVLDDIIDMSDIRRGKATINNRWGNEMALIACDVMLSLAIREITRSDLGLTKQMIDCVANSMLRLAEGEALELEKKQFTVDDYYRIAEKKTASLFSASAESGALVGNADVKHVEALRDYGRHLGLAFQARDDILDFISNTGQMGKPAFLDLRMNRPTLVMILATNDGLPREKMLGLGRDELLAELGPFIEKAGDISKKEAGDAKRALDAIPSGLPRDRLEALCDYVVSRKK
ncbi:MAG TPA: polyprenyl synthetase family protein [Methanocella sp.]|uniref:polyprenyl synthetase family protein n=1 Tax=Methanocella sp. TaxID=2052833 RepID=UPI002CE8ED1E|nr:polyprenyl synthetase family protein [Methanocella sp.]HTY91257.1 polyprenyl synthetase family protein [Methanocella sp.]